MQMELVHGLELQQKHQHLTEGYLANKLQATQSLAHLLLVMHKHLCWDINDKVALLYFT